MKFALAFAAGALAAPAAHQLVKRAPSDIQILNYALTLEHLEYAFYRDALKKFPKSAFTKAGFSDFFYTNLMQIREDESTHVSFLTGAIKGLDATPVKECTYDFGYTDVKSFLGVANILEGVGITAYLGAAASIASKTYLTYAGSVLTVEARHSSYLRSQGSKPGRSPFPQAFDVPLDFNEVYSLASQFIVSCPKGSPKLPFKAFPPLAVAPGTPAVIMQGKQFQVESPSVTFKAPVYGYFIYTTGPVQVPVKIGSGGKSLTVTAPSADSGIAGQSYLVITKAKNVTDESIVAGPAVVPIRTSYIPNM